MVIVGVGRAVMTTAFVVVVGNRPTGEVMTHRCGGQMFALRHERQMRESSCSAIGG